MRVQVQVLLLPQRVGIPGDRLRRWGGLFEELQITDSR